jgi:hypothetical protein
MLETALVFPSELESADQFNSKGTTNALQELERFAPDRFEDGRLSEHGLDPGIRHYVLILRSQGIETFQSCQGGPGHTYLEPTIEFHGGKSEGPRAVAAAFAYGLPVSELRRVWNISDSELDGPIWSMTFAVKADVHLEAVAVCETAYFERKKTGRDAG